VKEYERAVILRLGRILPGGAKGPGLFFILPCIDSIMTVDLRTITFDVPPQEILSKDSVTITVDAVCYFRVFNPVISVINVENAQFSTRLLAATTLRNILGTRTLQEILREKEAIAQQMQVYFLMKIKLGDIKAVFKEGTFVFFSRSCLTLQLMIGVLRLNGLKCKQS